MNETNCLVENVVELLIELGVDCIEARNLSDTEAMILCVSKLSGKSNAGEMSYAQRKYTKEIVSLLGVDNNKIKDLTDIKLIILCIHKLSDKLYNDVVFAEDECIVYLNGLYDNILFINGEYKTVKEWAHINDLSEDIILDRYNNGVRGSALVNGESLSTEKYDDDNICVSGIIHSAQEWVDIIEGVSYDTINDNIRLGKTNIDILTNSDSEYSELRNKVSEYKSTIENESLIDLKRFDFVWNNNLRTVSRLMREFIEADDYENTPDNFRKNYKLVAFGVLEGKDGLIVFTRLGNLFRMALDI